MLRLLRGLSYLEPHSLSPDNILHHSTDNQHLASSMDAPSTSYAASIRMACTRPHCRWQMSLPATAKELQVIPSSRRLRRALQRQELRMQKQQRQVAGQVRLDSPKVAVSQCTHSGLHCTCIP